MLHDRGSTEQIRVPRSIWKPSDDNVERPYALHDESLNRQPNMRAQLMSRTIRKERERPLLCATRINNCRGRGQAAYLSC